MSDLKNKKSIVFWIFEENSHRDPETIILRKFIILTFTLRGE